jgi:hypothetical protein
MSTRPVRCAQLKAGHSHGVRVSAVGVRAQEQRRAFYPILSKRQTSDPHTNVGQGRPRGAQFRRHLGRVANCPRPDADGFELSDVRLHVYVNGLEFTFRP